VLLAEVAQATRRLADAGVPGRSLQLDIEGAGAGRWLLPLDSPGAVASPDQVVAQVAMDSEEFCQLAAGRLEPERAVPPPPVELQAHRGYKEAHEKQRGDSESPAVSNRPDVIPRTF